MKTTPFIALAFLTAASAEAQTKTGNSGLPYDRLSVVRSFGSDVHSTGVVGSVQVWDFLIGADFSRSTYSKLGTLTDKKTGFTLGYLVGTGDADLIFSLNYAKGKGTGVLHNGTSAVFDGEQSGGGVAWRQRINASLDYTFSYGHLRTNYTGTFIASPVDSQDILGLSVRYAFNKSVDFTLGYSHGLGGGGIIGDKNTWSVALGCFF